MFPVLRILGFTIPVGPLLGVIAYFLAAEISGRALDRIASKAEQQRWRNAYGNATFIAFLTGLVGARLGYALLNYSTFLQAPQAILSLRPAMFSPYFGLITGGGVLLFLMLRRGVPFWRLADALVVGVAAGLALLALRAFLVGDGYGMPVMWPWTIVFDAAQRHLVQVYEAVLLSGLAIWLWSKQKLLYSGATFWHFVLGYSLIQLFVDAYRGNTILWSGGVRAIQVVALGAALLATYVLVFYADREYAADQSA